MPSPVHQPCNGAATEHRFASRRLELDAGESLFFHSKAGSALISTSGTLLVTGAPRWLGEQVVCHDAVLEADKPTPSTRTAGSR